MKYFRRDTYLAKYIRLEKKKTEKEIIWKMRIYSKRLWRVRGI